MLRTSTTAALLAGSALALGLAGKAQAGPTIDLLWRVNGTPTISAMQLGPGGEATADVVLRADNIAVGGVFISFLFDEDGKNELDLRFNGLAPAGGELLIVKIGMGNSFSPIVPGFSEYTESTTGFPGTGVLGGFDQALLSSGLASGTVTLGTLAFIVNSTIDDSPADVRPLIRSNGLDGMTQAVTGTLLDAVTTFNGAFVTGTTQPVVPTFQGLGDLSGGAFHSRAFAVSDQGQVVVGQSESEDGPEAFRWQSGVMTPLGDLPGGAFESAALDVSQDGSVVVGHASSAASTPNREAFRWQNGVLTGLGDLLGGTFDSVAHAVSANGSVIVGAGRPTATQSHAVRWVNEVPIALGTAGGDDSILKALTADASIGAGEGSENGRSALVWDNPAWEWEVLPHLGCCLGGAAGISDDGSIVVGRESVDGTSAGFAAVRWVGGVAQDLGLLPNADGAHEALGVSGDGSFVVGAGTTTQGRRAFAWTPSGGIRLLDDVLASDLGMDLTGWILLEATHVSRDGTAIVGTGVNPSGEIEGWLATIPARESASCDVELSRTSYSTGETVTISRLRYANPSGAPLTTRLKLQLTIPVFATTFDLLDIPAVLPNGLDNDLAPVTMFTVAGQPLGPYELRCALEEQGTGVVQSEDIATFTVQ